MKLYVFNPDTDMALANNDENYMPPASARHMAKDLALLPMWYAQPGSGVLASSAYNAEYLEQMKCQFQLSAQLITRPELPDYAYMQVVPWGWNPALRKQLLQEGVRQLPSLEFLNEYRALASREIGGVIADRVSGDFPADAICGSRIVLSDPETCRVFVEQHNPCVLKAPWSGSGKGLNWCKGGFTPSIAGWCRRILKEQGMVVGEPVYDKTIDFAMEFYSDGRGKVLFLGYSSFITTPTGAYIGNLLASSQTTEKEVTAYVPLSTLLRVKESVLTALTTMVGCAYTGYLGVDMMICKEDGRCKIHPCVEVNLRMTMGVVAHLFHKNFMREEQTGRFMVTYYSTHEKLEEEHRANMSQYPMVVEDGRLLSGYLPLVPVTLESRYLAYVFVGK